MAVYHSSTSMVEITWEEFGHILVSYESWQIKLEIRDKSEEF